VPERFQARGRDERGPTAATRQGHPDEQLRIQSCLAQRSAGYLSLALR
jgi:hypothetical protein